MKTEKEKAQESLSNIKLLCRDLSGDPETLTSIQNFICQMQGSLKEPCPNHPEVDVDIDESIVKFQEAFKNFLDENKSVSKVAVQKFAKTVEKPTCIKCPRQPCKAEETISLFLKSFES